MNFSSAQTSEELLLSAMFRDNSLIPEIAAAVSPLDFQDRTLQLFFFIVLDLDKAGVGVDAAAVADRLKDLIDKKRVLRDYHFPFLGLDTVPMQKLADLQTGYVSGNLTYHAQVVRNNGIFYRLAVAGEEIHQSAKARAGSPADLLSQAEKNILEIGGGIAGSKVKTISRHTADALLTYDDRRQKKNTAEVRYGFADLDKITGGMHAEELILVAARTSVGKTALAVNVARNVAIDQGKTVYIASLEQSGVELANRLLCAQGMLCSQKMRLGTFSDDETLDLSQAADVVGGSPIVIDDSANQGIYHILTNCRQAKRKHNLALVIVDYVQLVDAENRQAQRHEQVGEVSRKLKQMAKELKVPVLALAQVNRNADNRSEGKPRLSDLRESGSLEQDSDTVIFLYRSQSEQKHDGECVNAIYVDVAKQRNGPTGEMVLAYRKDCFRFENYAREYP